MKKAYRAARTSSFMPFDQGNRWVVIGPDGLIFGVLEEGIHEMTQNEAIKLARELNEKA